MINKQVSATFVVREEQIALHWDGFPRLGHDEYDEITEEDRKQYAAEAAAIGVLLNAQWVDLFEFDYIMRPLERKRWVPDETIEEYLVRYRKAKAAGWKRPNPYDAIVQRAWTASQEPGEPSPADD